MPSGQHRYSRLGWGKSVSVCFGLRGHLDDLSTTGKAFLITCVVVSLLLIAILIIISPSKVFEALASWVVSLRGHAPAPLYLILGIIITSLPPMMGYGTLCTVAGFAYGPWLGWLISASGCLLGSATSFLLCRRFLTHIEPWLARQSAFSALSKAVDRKGLRLLIIVRLCPFPFSYSNFFFASLPSPPVTLHAFLLATACSTPKLLLHAFVGSRLLLLAEGDSTDAVTKVLNVLYIAVSSILGMGTSAYVYQITLKEAREGDIILGVCNDEEPRSTSRTLDDEEDEIRRELLGDQHDA